MNPFRRTLDVIQEDGMSGLIRKTMSYPSNQVKRSMTQSRHLRYRFRWGKSAPDPYQLINIDPTAVEYVQAPRFVAELSKHGTYIKDGDWDQRVIDDNLMFSADSEDGYEHRGIVPIEKFELYQSCRHHFLHDVPWEETKIYEEALNRKGDASPYFETNESIKRRFAYLDELYDSIKHNGYKKQAELGDSTCHPKQIEEIMINIGRSGTLILDDNKHRLILSKIIGIDSVPVRVFVRHTNWQQIRHKQHQDQSHDVSDDCIAEPHPDLTNNCRD